MARASLTPNAARLATAAATTVFAVGTVLLSGTAAHSLGGLCDGRPASRPSLDASGQPGPTVIEGTRRSEVIIGSDGDDTIDGNGGNDTICGGPGDDTINVGPGGDSYVNGGTGDDGPATVGRVHSVTFVGGAGNDDFEVGDTVATSYLYGGEGDDRLVHDGAGHVKIDGGEDFNFCAFRGGDEAVNCDY